MESVCISYNLISFLESQLFSNLVSLLVAIGTIGAVVVALYLGLRKKKTKYRFSWAFSYPVFPFARTSGPAIQFELLNKTHDCQIVLKSAPFLWNRRNKTKTIIAENPMPGVEGKIPKKLEYGDSYKLLVYKAMMKKLLRTTNDEKLVFGINDAFGKTYEVKIRRKEMEKWVSEKG